MIISRNVDYYEMLLNKTRNHNGVLNTDINDLDKIKNAFEKSHDIRKFEIGLYWQRSGYILGFLSVLAAAIAYCFSSYVSKDTTEPSKFILLMSILCLTLVGISLTRFWTRIIKASKYWQENWEFHIDMLEPYVSGNLHKMHFYRVDEIYNRFSIHEVNLSICSRIGVIFGIVNIFSLAIIINNIFPFWSFDSVTKESIYLATCPIILLYLSVEIFVIGLFRKKDKLRKKNRILTKQQLKITIDKINCSRG